MDKVQKILSEIATRKLCTMDEHMAFYNDKAKDDYRLLSEIEEFVKTLQEESANVWHDIEELSTARECEYILVIYKDTTSPRVAGNKTQVSYWDRVDKWAYLDDLLKF